MMWTMAVGCSMTTTTGTTTTTWTAAIPPPSFSFYHLVLDDNHDENIDDDVNCSRPHSPLNCFISDARGQPPLGRRRQRGLRPPPPLLLIYLCGDDQHDSDDDNDVDGGRLPLLLFIFYVGRDDNLPAKECYIPPFSPCSPASAVVFFVDCKLILRGLSHTVLILFFVFIVGSCQPNTQQDSLSSSDTSYLRYPPIGALSCQKLNIVLLIRSTLQSQESLSTQIF